MKLDLSGKRCLLFTRSNTGRQAHANHEKRQVAKLQAFARRRHLDVIGHVGADGLVSTRRGIGAAISSVIEKKQSDTFDVLLMTDLSRLSRLGVCHAMHLISQLAAANVSVVTLDFGLVGNGVFNAFHLRALRKKKGCTSSHGKSKDTHHSAHHHPDDSGRGGEVPSRYDNVAQGTGLPRSRKTRGE